MKSKPDAILQEIHTLLKNKPEGTATKWHGELTRLLCFAPLKLPMDHPIPGTDGHPYLRFHLPDPEEVADRDYSEYTINEYAHTIIELKCGAIVSKGKTSIWSFSHGAIINLIREKTPYEQKDPRIWGWPTSPIPVSQIQKDQLAAANLPEETIEAIQDFLGSVKPPIKNWGLAACPKLKAMALYIEPSLPIETADPKKILEHLQWFTPWHYRWIALQSN